MSNKFQILSNRPAARRRDAAQSFVRTVQVSLLSQATSLFVIESDKPPSMSVSQAVLSMMVFGVLITYRSVGQAVL